MKKKIEKSCSICKSGIRKLSNFNDGYVCTRKYPCETLGKEYWEPKLNEKFVYWCPYDTVYKLSKCGGKSLHACFPDSTKDCNKKYRLSEV